MSTPHNKNLSRESLRARLLDLACDWRTLHEEDHERFPHASDMAEILTATLQTEARCIDPTSQHEEQLANISEGAFVELAKTARRIRGRIAKDERATHLRTLLRMLEKASEPQNQDMREARERKKGRVPRPLAEAQAHTFVLWTVRNPALRNLAPQLRDVRAYDHQAVAAASASVARAFEKVGFNDIEATIRSGFRALGGKPASTRHLFDFLDKASNRRTQKADK